MQYGHHFKIRLQTGSTGSWLQWGIAYPTEALCTPHSFRPDIVRMRRSQLTRDAPASGHPALIPPLYVLRIPFGPGVSPDAEEAGALCTPHSSGQAVGLDAEERVAIV